MVDAGSLSRRAVLRTSAVAAGAAALGIGASTSTATAQVGEAIAVQDVKTSLFHVTSTDYGTDFDSGDYADCAVVFVAPESGRVMVLWSGAARNTYSGPGAIAYLSVEVREGDIIGSGDVVLQPDHSRTVRTNLYDSQTVRAGTSYLLSGLTPGESYNARLLHKVSSQQGEFFQRNLIVVPAP